MHRDSTADYTSYVCKWWAYTPTLPVTFTAMSSYATLITFRDNKFISACTHVFLLIFTAYVQYVTC